MEIHYYENHEEVIRILTKEYGFRYDGIGDNGEECFRKESATPEIIFVHPMFCSYCKRASPDIFAERIDNFYRKSTSWIQVEQKMVFNKLLKHLNVFMVGVSKQERIKRQFFELEQKRCRLGQLAVNTEISTELRQAIPVLYDKILTEQYRLIFQM